MQSRVSRWLVVLVGVVCVFVILALVSRLGFRPDRLTHKWRNVADMDSDSVGAESHAFDMAVDPAGKTGIVILDGQGDLFYHSCGEDGRWQSTKIDGGFLWGGMKSGEWELEGHYWVFVRFDSNSKPRILLFNWERSRPNVTKVVQYDIAKGRTFRETRASEISWMFPSRPSVLLGEDGCWYAVGLALTESEVGRAVLAIKVGTESKETQLCHHYAGALGSWRHDGMIDVIFADGESVRVGVLDASLQLHNEEKIASEPEDDSLDIGFQGPSGDVWARSREGNVLSLYSREDGGGWKERTIQLPKTALFLRGSANKQMLSQHDGLQMLVTEGRIPGRLGGNRWGILGLFLRKGQLNHVALLQETGNVEVLSALDAQDNLHLLYYDYEANDIEYRAMPRTEYANVPAIVFQSSSNMR